MLHEGPQHVHGRIRYWRLSHRSIRVVVVATVDDAGRKGPTMVRASSKGRGGDIAFLLLREEVVVLNHCEDHVYSQRVAYLVT